MKPDLKVIGFIDLLKATFGRYKDYSGGCYKFHLILKKVFGGQGFYNSDHVITKIGDVYYDIDGVVESTEGYLPLSAFGEEHMQSSFWQYICTIGEYKDALIGTDAETSGMKRSIKVSDLREILRRL